MRILTTIGVFVAAANATLLAFIQSYDLRLGPLHLAAHDLFKPLLYLSAALLVAVLVSGVGSRETNGPPAGWAPSLLVTTLVTVALYAPSVFVNYDHHDWTHRHISADITSLGAALHLFTRPQGDGFYRPLPFLSLWLDYTIFHAHYWGYHLQSIALHVANACFLARLGERIGLQAASARFAALLFATAAVNFEPVLWPAARFDLMATLFTILALLTAQRYRSQDAVWHSSLGWMMAAFAAGALSKESAFCFPLLLVLLMPGAAMTLRRWTALMGGTGIVVALAVAARIAIYGRLGGYPQAPHFVFHTSSVTAFFTRVLPVPPFALNVSVPLSPWAIAAVAGFAIASCGLAVTCKGWFWRDATLVVAAILSAVPAVNLVNWIGASTQNTRYLYMSSMWIFLMLASVASSSRSRRWLTVLVVANCIGASHNVAAYRPIMPLETAAAAPRSDCRSCPAP